MTNEELVRRIQAGEAGLLAQLMEQNRGIMARRYLPAAQRNRGVDFDDLMQAAAVGILGAVPRWEENRGRFLPLAVFYMRSEIRDALGVRTTRKRIENAAPPVSLSSPVDMEEGSATIGESLPDPNAPDPQEEAERADMQRIVRECVAALPDGPREAVERRWFMSCPMAGKEARSLERKAYGQLRRDRKLKYLWHEYESAAWFHMGISGWDSTWTSSTEWAVLRRADILEEMGGRIAGREKHENNRQAVI